MSDTMENGSVPPETQELEGMKSLGAPEDRAPTSDPRHVLNQALQYVRNANVPRGSQKSKLELIEAMEAWVLSLPVFKDEEVEHVELQDASGSSVNNLRWPVAKSARYWTNRSKLLVFVGTRTQEYKTFMVSGISTEPVQFKVDITDESGKVTDQKDTFSEQSIGQAVNWARNWGIECLFIPVQGAPSKLQN